MTVEVVDALRQARERTLGLVDGLPDAELERVHSRLMSPLVWDLGHIAAFEDLWLVHRFGGEPMVRRDLADVYDAFETPRAARGDVPLLDGHEARAYLDAVRERALAVLDRVDLGPGGGPLNAGGYVWRMVAQHEQQHDETMLATHQLRSGAPVLQAPPPPSARPPAVREVLVPGGPFTMGTSTEPWALDNERPAHVVDVPAFVIDT
ncbi:MAG: DinB family protein, partial [Actinomycetota bacterium]|nr:DinB family protein [Actinomycetota bacterium]